MYACVSRPSKYTDELASLKTIQLLCSKATPAASNKQTTAAQRLPTYRTKKREKKNELLKRKTKESCCCYHWKLDVLTVVDCVPFVMMMILFGVNPIALFFFSFPCSSDVQVMDRRIRPIRGRPTVEEPVAARLYRPALTALTVANSSSNKHNLNSNKSDPLRR